MIAKTAVDGLTYALDKAWSYRVPEGMALRPGMRVSVPFGKGNRVLEGMVLALEAGDGQGLKQVLEALDREPVMTEQMLRLAAFVRERYFCTFYDAIHAMLPGGLWLQSSAVLETDKLPEDWADRLESDAAAAVLIRLVLDAGGCLSEDRLLRQSGDRAGSQEALGRLIQRRWLRRRTELVRKNADRTERIVHCAASAGRIAEFCGKKRRSAPIQAAVMELLGTVGTISWKELRYFTGASLQTLHSLEKAGLVTLSLQELLRTPEIRPAFVGAEAAFRHGEEWLGQLLQYLKANAEYTRQFLASHMPRVKAVIPEASFLVWLDFSEYGFSHEETLHRIQDVAGLALNDGTSFGGDAYRNCFRINIGCPRATLAQALDKLKDAF